MDTASWADTINHDTTEETIAMTDLTSTSAYLEAGCDLEALRIQQVAGDALKMAAAYGTVDDARPDTFSQDAFCGSAGMIGDEWRALVESTGEECPDLAAMDAAAWEDIRIARDAAMWAGDIPESQVEKLGEMWPPTWLPDPIVRPPSFLPPVPRSPIDQLTERVASIRFLLTVLPKGEVTGDDEDTAQQIATMRDTLAWADTRLASLLGVSNHE